MLQNTKANRQSVHKVLKKKAATEVLSYEFVHLVLNGHGGALTSLFASFMDVSSLFFTPKEIRKSTEIYARRGNCCRLIFTLFSLIFHKAKLTDVICTN